MGWSECGFRQPRCCVWLTQHLVNTSHDLPAQQTPPWRHSGNARNRRTRQKRAKTRISRKRSFRCNHSAVRYTRLGTRKRFWEPERKWLSALRHWCFCCSRLSRGKTPKTTTTYRVPSSNSRRMTGATCWKANGSSNCESPSPLGLIVIIMVVDIIIVVVDVISISDCFLQRRERSSMLEFRPMKICFVFS